MITTFKKDDYIFHKRLRKAGRVLLVDESRKFLVAHGIGDSLPFSDFEELRYASEHEIQQYILEHLKKEIMFYIIGDFSHDYQNKVQIEFNFYDDTMEIKIIAKKANINAQLDD